MWLIRLPFLSFKSEAVLKNEVKKRNLFITFSFAFFKSETLVSCTMKYIRKRETHITQIHRSVLKLMQKKNTSWSAESYMGISRGSVSIDLPCESKPCSGICKLKRMKLISEDSVKVKQQTTEI
ncbi:unnamed protein product [Brassica napus]|uniref:(rape) hypothetical protein n=1 Tax=Brassica napus TaxID=3708 RepID=A0A816XWM2_BRANA|nr:unnamed protein product [Brassica napus]